MNSMNRLVLTMSFLVALCPQWGFAQGEEVDSVTYGEAAQAFAYLLDDPTARWEMSQRAARLGNPRAAERVIDLLQGQLMRAEAERGV